jgi:alginate O-acetyltransferase complex protein AlgJ
VAKEMMARPDFPKANGTGAVLGPAVTETHFKSDLASVLPPEMRGQYPNEDYVVRREVFTAKKTALTDDPQGDIVIVGSSYLQPKYNFAPALSSELKQSVQLHWRIHNVGPYRTLLEYVGGGAFKKKKPKVLIWCFLENDVEAMLDDKSVWFDMAIGGDEFLQQLTKSVTV